MIVNDDGKCTVMDVCFLGKFNGFGITLGIGLRVSQVILVWQLTR